MIRRPVAIVVSAAAVLACSPEVVARTAPDPERQFARSFLVVLRDSGVQAASARLKPSTAARPTIVAALDTLRAQLLSASPSDSLPLIAWEVERPKSGPAATHLLYSVPGLAAPFQVGIWVERHEGTLVAETIHYGPCNPKCGLTLR